MSKVTSRGNPLIPCRAKQDNAFEHSACERFGLDWLPMPHARHHRGAHPEDRELFSDAAIETLRLAAHDCVYLLDRGYAMDSVVDVVSRRYALRVRQRAALQRCACSSEQLKQREGKRLDLERLRGASVEVDGFNLIIGLEVALSGGLLLRGNDGAIRDLAGLRGSYRMVQETDAALIILGDVLREFAPSALRVWLDRPVSNSGRLKARLLELAAGWAWPVEVNLAANPDRELRGLERVVSSDSAVLDSAASWLNMLGYVVQQNLRTAWLVDFAAAR